MRRTLWYMPSARFSIMPRASTQTTAGAETISFFASVLAGAIKMGKNQLYTIREFVWMAPVSAENGASRLPFVSYAFSALRRSRADGGIPLVVPRAAGHPPRRRPCAASAVKGEDSCGHRMGDRRGDGDVRGELPGGRHRSRTARHRVRAGTVPGHRIFLRGSAGHPRGPPDRAGFD